RRRAAAPGATSTGRAPRSRSRARTAATGRSPCRTAGIRRARPELPYARCWFQWPSAILRPAPVTRRRGASQHEQKKERDQQREDAERLGERKAQKQGVALTAGSRRIAQRAGEKLAEHVGDADRGGAHADARQAGADVFRCNWIHWEAPFRVRSDRVEDRETCASVCGMKRVVEVDAGEDGEHVGLQEGDQQ